MSYSGKESGRFFGLTGTGVLVATAADDFAVRTLASGNQISITNPAGTAGNPTINVAQGLTPGSYTNANITVDANGNISVVANGTGGGASVGNSTPLALGTSAQVGTASTAMRSDAVIQFPLATVSQTLTATGSIAATDHGRVVEWNATNANLTLPNNLPAGFNCLVLVIHASGIPTFVAASGATIRQADGYTKGRKQWSLVSVMVRTNSNGTSAEYILAGDMS